MVRAEGQQSVRSYCLARRQDLIIGAGGRRSLTSDHDLRLWVAEALRLLWSGAYDNITGVRCTRSDDRAPGQDKLIAIASIGQFTYLQACERARLILIDGGFQSRDHSWCLGEHLLAGTVSLVGGLYLLCWCLLIHY